MVGRNSHEESARSNHRIRVSRGKLFAREYSRRGARSGESGATRPKVMTAERAPALKGTLSLAACDCTLSFSAMPLAQPKPSWLGYSPPPASLVMSTTSFLGHPDSRAINAPVEVQPSLARDIRDARTVFVPQSLW